MTGAQLTIIVAAGLITYAIRASFIAVADRMVELPPRVTTVLRMIPPAALAALVLPAVLRPDGGAYVPVSGLVAGAIAAAIVSRWKGNVGLSLLVGLAVLIATRPVLG